MKQAFIFLASLLFLTGLRAQDFVIRGKIEFEVKRNNKRMMSESDPGDNSLLAFDVSYRDLIFSGNHLLYQPGRKAVGRIDDSVYVVAFYCPEIIPQGGPELKKELGELLLKKYKESGWWNDATLEKVLHSITGYTL